MTDTAVVKTGAPADEPVLKLSRQPGYHDMMALAATLLQTGFLPEEIKTPGQALAIILTGQELQLGPMQSLRSISVIKGTPTLKADLQLGLFHRDGGKSKWEKLEADQAVLWLKHPNGVEHTETFTMADAQKAGLTQGRGDNYAKFAKAMLRSRCITAGLKSVGFLPTTGLYDPEELGGIVPTTEELAQKPKALQQEDRPLPTDAHGAPDGPTWKNKPMRGMETKDLLGLRAWFVKQADPKWQPKVEQIDEVLASRGGE